MMEDYEEYEEDESEYYAVRPNKTQIKKVYASLFALGEEMSKLSAAHLRSIELPEAIHKAVTEVGTMPHTGARKRLLKFISGQLYKIDIEPIMERLNRIKNQSAHAVREHHIAERWRDRLIAEGNEALTELLDEYPQADAQHIRQLMRNVQKETTTAQPPKSTRLLYRYLKTLVQTDEYGEEEDIELTEDEMDSED